MSKLRNSKTAKVVSGLVGMLTAVTMVGGSAFTASADAQSDALQAQINSLLATIQSLQAQLGASTGSTSTTACTFTRDLTIGSDGADVKCLQQYLNSKGFTVSATGAGSVGNESTYFGAKTQAAVAKWQSSNGVTPAAGYFGAKSRAKYTAIAGTVTTNPGNGGTTTPTGTGLSVMSASQPAASLAPKGASRVPFTSFTLTASNDGDVVVNGVTVERQGLAQDAAFAGVALVDSNGIQLDIAKTFNSNHQATVGGTFTVPRGTSKTFTVVGNMAADTTNYSGQVATLAVVGVNTSAAVNGSLPIIGAGQTINSTLTIGTATVQVSSFDPGSNVNKEVGTTGYTFSGLRVTAGSAEQVRLWSVRWNQSGSAGSGDIANVQVIVDGTAYPTTVSTDGKYYTAVFSGGLLIDKGLSRDIYVKADLVGNGSANRTVKFDIYKTTDVYLSGVTYGYGITPTGTGTSGSTVIANTTPWFSGSTVTITGGSVSTVSKAASVPSQNIAVNVPNQILGGFDLDLKGEALSVQGMTFSSTTVGTWGSGGITSASLYNENGAVIAGPVDTNTSGNIVFTDTVTFPTGKHTYTIKGKVPTGTLNGATIALTTNPSTWQNVTGQSTGNTISLASLSSFTMNTMTVKGSSLAVSVSATPSAQTIIAGGSGVLFANYQLDATQSGEDVRLNSLSLQLTTSANNIQNNLSACQIWDGSKALNTGSNTVNPTVPNPVSTTANYNFTFDQSLVVAKGTVKTLALTCNVSGAATTNQTYAFGIVNTPTATGLASGNTVTPTVSTSAGQTMTIAGNGSLTVVKDSSSPSFALAAGGTSGVTLGVLKFHANNESVNLNKVALQRTSGAVGSLTQVTLWDGSTQVGTVVFAGSSANATATLTAVVTVPKDGDKLITMKGDFAPIGSNQSGVEGQLVQVDYDGNDPTGTQGVGQGSGTTVNASGSDTAMDGVRTFHSFPTVALGSGLPSNGISDGRLMRFSVTANASGDVGIAEFNFTIATSSAAVSNINLFGYTDSGYSQAISGVGNSGQFMASNQSTSASSPYTVSIYPQTSVGGMTTVQIPAGQTRYFELRGIVTAASGATNYSVVTTLNGDSTYQTNLTVASTATSSYNFVWSGNATTTSGLSNVDWTNGYGVLGLPGSGLIQSRTN